MSREKCTPVDNYFIDTVDKKGYKQAMSSQKKEINFNEYWDFFKQEAKRRDWTDGRFMSTCKIPRQRYYEFNNTRNVTATYMVKLMEGMGLSQEKIEVNTGRGRKFTNEQVQSLRKESWVSAHTNIIEGLMEYPALIPLVESQIALMKIKK